MKSFINKRYFLKAIAVFIVILFTTTSFAASIGISRIIPNGKVFVYDGNRKTGELNAEAPLPEGKTLKVEGNCGVKMETLYLAATDKSVFAVNSQGPDRNLVVKEGKIFFGINAMPHPLSFVTPRGMVVAQQVILQAAAPSGLLKGYVSVMDKQAEIGVIEGGSMIISTADGEVKIDAGNRFLLAQANVPGGQGPGPQGPGYARGMIIAGATFGTLLAIPLIGNAISDDDASPKQ